jgi:predicted nucleic acid-binding protein
LLIQRYPRLFGKGISRGTADAFIGATAWSLGLPLYTLNTRHFAKIPIAEIQIRAIDQTTPDWL